MHVLIYKNQIICFRYKVQLSLPVNFTETFKWYSSVKKDNYTIQNKQLVYYYRATFIKMCKISQGTSNYLEYNYSPYFT